MTTDLDARMAAVQRKFLDRCSKEREQLGSVASLTEDDLRHIGQAAHKIAGLAGTLGFSSLGNAAAQLDQRIADQEGVGPAYQLYMKELDNVLRNSYRENARERVTAGGRGLCGQVLAGKQKLSV